MILYICFYLFVSFMINAIDLWFVWVLERGAKCIIIFNPTCSIICNVCYIPQYHLTSFFQRNLFVINFSWDSLIFWNLALTFFYITERCILVNNDCRSESVCIKWQWKLFCFKWHRRDINIKIILNELCALMFNNLPAQK